MWLTLNGARNLRDNFDIAIASPLRITSAKLIPMLFKNSSPPYKDIMQNWSVYVWKKQSEEENYGGSDYEEEPK